MSGEILTNSEIWKNDENLMMRIKVAAKAILTAVPFLGKIRQENMVKKQL